MCSKLMILFLGIAATAWCADPFVGTWKMDVAKSHYTTGTAPKSQTVTFTESGGNLDTSVAVTTADGTDISYQFTVPMKGGTGTVVKGVGFDGVSGKRINANTRETTLTQAGKTVRTAHLSVSKDGKTLHTTIKGVDPQGKPVNATLVSERQ